MQGASARLPARRRARPRPSLPSPLPSPARQQVKCSAPTPSPPPAARQHHRGCSTRLGPANPVQHGWPRARLVSAVRWHPMFVGPCKFPWIWPRQSCGSFSACFPNASPSPLVLHGILTEEVCPCFFINALELGSKSRVHTHRGQARGEHPSRRVERGSLHQFPRPKYSQSTSAVSRRLL